MISVALLQTEPSSVQQGPAPGGLLEDGGDKQIDSMEVGQGF